MGKDTECKTCGCQFQFDVSKGINLCPQCGSNELVRKVFLQEKIAAHETLKGKIKDKKFSSKKNPRKEFITGAELRKADGKWMQKERLIDKDNNLYKETVIDPETGKIIHQCKESLDNHMGHGSAKKK
ncbi:MAG: hypothetical protein NT096_09570 [Proteobacteria bacterium]|nr:hypothetical protein [Pseudomonadota bacterium]